MFRWSLAGRAIVFILAAASIWCLLAEFYGLCSMRTFTFVVLIPATVALITLALFDRLRGDHRLWRGVVIGAVAGLVAAVAYDVFRLPFVFAHEWHLTSLVPPMNLFKVFPRFGAMILGEPVNQPHYSLAAQAIGWAYHFSNGITFGVMYTALIGDGRQRHWGWAVLMAVGLELGMLFTPYPGFFGIPLTATFITVTLAAHLIFGVAMGHLVQRLSQIWSIEAKPGLHC
jgi:hypothetical protein